RISSTPVNIKTDDSGNVFMLGMMNDTVDFDPGPGVYTLDTTQGKMFIVKLDSAGNFRWAKNFGGDNTSGYGELCTDKNGNVICVCFAERSVDFDPGPGVFIPAERSTVILKFDNNGAVQWVKAFEKSAPTAGVIFGKGLGADVHGNIYIHGFVSGDGDFDPGPALFTLDCSTGPGGSFLCKLDKDGQLVWAKLLHCATGWAWWGAYSSGTLALGRRNDIYVTGSFSGSADFDPGPGVYTLSAGSSTSMEGYVTKFDQDGNFTWAKQISGVAIYYPCIALDPGDNVYLSGTYGLAMDADPGPYAYLLETKGTDSRNGFLLKLDSAGAFRWAKGYYWKGSIDYTNHIDIDRNGYLYLRRFLRDSSFLYNTAKQQFITAADKDGSSVLLKLSIAGTLLGSKTLAAASKKSNVSASYVDRYSNIYAGGSFYDTVLLDPYAAAKTITTKGANAVFLMKLAQSVPVSLHSFSTVENCSVYPNPTKGPLTLLIDGFEKEATTEVFSIDGRILLSQTTTQSRVALDIGHYPAGMYLVRVSDAQRKTYIKVLKQ
ncbi:MAG: T9SS type A sorting domain-containing protein, partial [Chitinophagaceae bacterium]|nr:T9SS type A sorting domain-containing protein [Chitinophagaceae bacterium]